LFGAQVDKLFRDLVSCVYTLLPKRREVYKCCCLYFREKVETSSVFSIQCAFVCQLETCTYLSVSLLSNTSGISGLYLCSQTRLATLVGMLVLKHICLNFRFVVKSPFQIPVEIRSNLTVIAGNFTEICLGIDNLKGIWRESEGNTKGIK